MNGHTEGKRSMKIKVFFATLFIIGVAIISTGCSSNVDFQDPLIERCLREALGKDEKEPVTDKECADLKELKIDCDKGLTLIWDNIRLAFGRGNYVDLSDLKYFKGLVSLEINNNPAFDILTNLDSIANCEKLETLTFNDSESFTNIFWDWQYSLKDYGNIVKKLPNLKTINIDDYSFSDKLNDWVIGEKKDLVINKTQDYNYNPIRSIYPIAIEGIYPAYSFEDIPDDIEDLILINLGDAEIDFSYFNKFSNLKSLILYGEYVISNDPQDMLKENALFTIKNAEALKANEKLYSLSICGAKGDFSGIGELTGLKELTIVGSRVNDTSFISNLINLRELNYLSNISLDFSENLKASAKNLTRLKFLNLNTYDFNDTSWFSDFKVLEAVKYSHTAPYSFMGETTSPSGLLNGLKGCKNVKYFSCIFLTIEEDLDLAPLTRMDQLQYVVLTNNGSAFTGVNELISKIGLKSLVLDIKPVSSINRWLQEGVKNDSLGRLMIGDYIKYADYYDYYRQRFGDEWLRETIEQTRDEFRQCYDKHIMCGGYDSLIYVFDSVDEIEKFIDEGE